MIEFGEIQNHKATEVSTASVSVTRRFLVFLISTDLRARKIPAHYRGHRRPPRAGAVLAVQCSDHLHIKHGYFQKMWAGSDIFIYSISQ